MKRALLDENAPKRLGRLLRSSDLDVQPFPNAWKGLSNGRLLDRMQMEGFSVLVTYDQSIPAQQNLARRNIGMLILGTNQVPTLARHLETIRSFIRSVQPGDAMRFDLPAS